MNVDFKKIKAIYEKCKYGYENRFRNVEIEGIGLLSRDACKGFVLCYDLFREVLSKEKYRVKRGVSDGKEKKVDGERKESGKETDKEV